MGKYRKIGFLLTLLGISQAIFSGFAASVPMLVISNTGSYNGKIIPLKGGCQKIINNCGYPIGIPLYPSGSTKSFFVNKPSCVTLTSCFKTVACGGTLPANAVWNTSDIYTQTFNGVKWGPTGKTANYSATGSSDDCRYTCDVNYNWNGSSCIAATGMYVCPAKPSVGTIWNTVSGYMQTWNGTSWSPASTTTTYNTTASINSCRYTCAAGYRRDNTSSSCINTCTLPWGGTIADGQSVTAYDKTSGTCPSNNCASQTRTCNGTTGILSGSYINQTCNDNASSQSCSIANGVGIQTCTAGGTSRGSCTVASCNAGYRVSGNTCINTCTLPWGGTITNGQSVTAYDKTSGTCPTNNCASQTRTCDGTNGVLNGSYTNQTCNDNSNSQSCSITNGVGTQTCTGGSVSRGTCTIVSCNAGYRISGNTCINTCTLPWGGTITNGQSVLAYDKTSGTCPTNNCAVQTRTCDGTNGLLNGSYINQTCSDNANSQTCTVSNGGGNQTCIAGGASRGACGVTRCATDYYDDGGANDCVYVGAGYYSPNLSVTRTVCTNYPDTASRDYTYTSAGGGTNNCSATYSPLCGVDLYETSNGVCSAVGVGYYSPNLDNTRTACTTKPSNSTYTSAGGGIDSCTRTCDSGYHAESGLCVPNDKVVSCTGKPLNSIYNTATSITQTWNGSSRQPSAVATYNATASTTECRYTCDAGYTWDGSSCVPSGCKVNADCGTGLVCIPAGCGGTINPCAMSNTVGYILGTNVKTNSCAIYSYGPPRLIYGLYFNTSENIPLDGGTTNSNFGDTACKSYYAPLCKTLTNYTGSYIDQVLVESSTPDKRVTTTTCGSDKGIVSGRANTNAVKSITCYYSSFSCSTITSDTVCSSTVGCTWTPGNGTCVVPACGSANGSSFDSLTSTSPNLCSIGSATNFTTASTSRSRNCGSATCSAHKNSCNGFGTNLADCSNWNCGAPGNPSCSDVICHANNCNAYNAGICSQYVCNTLTTQSTCLAKQGCSWN